MEMGFDHDAWPMSQVPGAEAAAVGGNLDWHGLRARFLAARACRRALDVGGGRRIKASGASFNRSAASALAEFEDASHGVNLNNSADGKAPLGIEENVAGASMRGDRG
jgi:hypothetical protein